MTRHRSATPASTAAFCDEARRIRGRYTRNVNQCHLALRRLNERHGRAARATQRGPKFPCGTDGPPVLPPKGSAILAETRFADIARRAISSPILRYSQRLRLLRDAYDQGVDRFEANLIIARVLHDRRVEPLAYEEGKRLLPGWAAIASIFVIVQGAIILGAWHVLG